MEFGDWLKVERLKQKLDMRGLSRLSDGVNAGTISRIESGEVEPTLTTAVRLSDALGFDWRDVAKALYALERKPTINFKGNKEEVLTIEDIEDFVALYKERPQHAELVFNQIVDPIKRHPIFPKHSTRFFGKRKPYDLVINYPPDLSLQDIIFIFQRGGVLTTSDLGHYLKIARRNIELTLSNMQTMVKISDSVLSRLERGEIEKVKLDDIWTLDVYFKADLQLVALAWKAFEFQSGVIRKQAQTGNRPARWEKHDIQLAKALVGVGRWLQLNTRLLGDPQWADNLIRKSIRQYSK